MVRSADNTARAATPSAVGMRGPDLYPLTRHDYEVARELKSRIESTMLVGLIAPAPKAPFYDPAFGLYSIAGRDGFAHQLFSIALRGGDHALVDPKDNRYWLKTQGGFGGPVNLQPDLHFKSDPLTYSTQAIQALERFIAGASVAPAGGTHGPRTAKVDGLLFTWSPTLKVEIGRAIESDAVSIKLGDQTTDDAWLRVKLSPNHAGPIRVGEKPVSIRANFTDGQSGEDRAAALAAALEGRSNKGRYVYGTRVDGDTVFITIPRLR
jgi:hypothetical protein